MYIKMIFKRSAWNVQNNGSECMDDLLSEPVIVENLPEDTKADNYTPVRSQFQSHQPDTFCYYMDCGDLPREKVNKALGQFKTHYQVAPGNMPAALTKIATGENEIISNMRVSLGNVQVKPAEKRPYFRQSSISTVEDLFAVCGRK